MNIQDKTFLVQLLTGNWHYTYAGDPNHKRLQRQGYITIGRTLRTSRASRNTYKLTVKGSVKAASLLSVISLEKKIAVTPRIALRQKYRSGIYPKYDMYGKRTFDTETST